MLLWVQLSINCIKSTFSLALSSQLVIAALKCHKYDKTIQVTGSAALFYLTNSDYRSEQSVRLRRQVIQVVLNGMESYQEVTVRHCCSFFVLFCFYLVSCCISKAASCIKIGRRHQNYWKILSSTLDHVEVLQEYCFHFCTILSDTLLTGD